MDTMKYIVETLKYLLKNILYIAVFGILPALFYMGMFDYDSFDATVRNLFGGTISQTTFGEWFGCFSLLNFSTWYGFLLSVIGFVVIVVCLSCMLGFIEKHMRIGKRTLNGVFSKLNDNILSTMLVAGIIVVIYEVWSLLTAALCFAAATVIQNIVVSYIFLILLFAGMTFVLLYVLSMFVLWLPCQLITGFGAYESLSFSYHMGVQNHRSLVLALLLPLVIGNVVLTIFTFLGNITLSFVVLIVYFCFVVYYGVFMEVVYAMESQMEREDLKPEYKRG